MKEFMYPLVSLSKELTVIYEAKKREINEIKEPPKIPSENLLNYKDDGCLEIIKIFLLPAILGAFLLLTKKRFSFEILTSILAIILLLYCTYLYIKSRIKHSNELEQNKVKLKIEIDNFPTKLKEYNTHRNKLENEILSRTIEKISSVKNTYKFKISQPIIKEFIKFITLLNKNDLQVVDEWFNQFIVVSKQLENIQILVSIDYPSEIKTTNLEMPTKKVVKQANYISTKYFNESILEVTFADLQIISRPTLCCNYLILIIDSIKNGLEISEIERLELQQSNLNQLIQPEYLFLTTSYWQKKKKIEKISNYDSMSFDDDLPF